MYQIGCDLCNPKRIEKAYKKFGLKFLRRILRESEIEDLKSRPKNLIYRLSARFAAKEAFAKALKTGIGKKLSFHDIEIYRNPENNSPEIKLHGAALKLIKELNIQSWDLSISHEDILVMATVILAFTLDF
jgi:holo-[acyl-carrier protein] synthase